MNQATPAVRALRWLAAIAFAACALPALAKPMKVKMRVISGGLASYMPAGAYNKPIVSWDANMKVLVHVVVTSNGSQVVDETSGRAHMQGDNITLCYRVRKIKLDKTPAEAATTFPEIMEFYLPGASTSKKYNITVRQDCR
jgi:nitrogen fixation protein